MTVILTKDTVSIYLCAHLNKTLGLKVESKLSVRFPTHLVSVYKSGNSLSSGPVVAGQGTT